MRDLKNNTEEIIAYGEDTNSSSGDTLKLSLIISNDGIIIDAEFSAGGCKELELLAKSAIDIIKNKTIDFALTFNVKDLIEKADNFEKDKEYTAELIENSIKKALGDYYTKTGVFIEEKSNCKCCGNCSK